MHISELIEKEVGFKHLFLDPNNPRFWTQKTFSKISDKKITDESVQTSAFNNIIQHDIEELKFSILRNGFLPMDKIVVRPINQDNYVVIEGNRRLAALKLLKRQIEDEEIQEDGISKEYLNNLLRTFEKLKVLVYNGDDNPTDITWMLQGIRHIGGIKRWEPAQSAKLLADKIEKNRESFTQAGQTFGISAKNVGKRYRAFKALKQMQNDDEYGKLAMNNYYSLFEETITRRDIKEWLGWDEDKYEFTNISKLKDFYSWICPDKEININSTDGRKINDPKQMKLLADLIKGDQVGLLSDDYHIEDAVKYLKSPTIDFEKTFDQINGLLGQIPYDAFDEEGFLKKAKETQVKLEKLIHRAEK